MRKVDIIIPIYNAFDDLQCCLDSLYRNTNLQENRLILINDNSPDDRIYPYLESQRRDNVIVIHNADNRGFSNNINIGMSQSAENDVILLNSDTVLTKNWVEKMVACAYSSKEIGTVTPLSNNATLCSVPNLFDENILPEGLSIEKAAAIVEECSLKKYPRISVAHGFCMLVKREVIDLIGNFDAETFGRGYGEENDFCNRAEQMGYINVMCDDTYIYHSGTKSFVSAEKARYIEEHQKILYERYPIQMKVNEKHCLENPNKLIGENIRRYWDICNGKRNVFYLVHSDFRDGAENNVGGTQMHVQHLKDELKYIYNIFVAAVDGQYLQVTAYIEDKEYVYRFFVGERKKFFQFHDRHIARLFKNLLVAFKIDCVHIHHVLTTSLDIFYEADKLNIPIVFTIHDFFSVCPNINLRSHRGDICYDRDDSLCKECLKDSAKIYNQSSYIELWRKEFSEALNLCAVIVAPSQSTKDIIGKYFPDLYQKIQVIYHGLNISESSNIKGCEIEVQKNVVIEDYKSYEKQGHLVVRGRLEIKENCNIKKVGKMLITIGDSVDESILPVYLNEQYCFKVWIPYNRIKEREGKINFFLFQDEETIWQIGKKEYCIQTDYQKKKIRVAFIGGINELKGAKIIKDIVSKSKLSVQWYIFGNIGDTDLLLYEKSNLVKIDKYNQSDVKSLLEFYSIDIVCILSVWPETFSYTLSEALGSGILTVVTDVGALGERIKLYQAGKAVGLDNATVNILTYLREMCDNEKKLEEEKKHCKELYMKTLSQMREDYQDLIDTILQNAIPRYDDEFDKDLIWHGMKDSYIVGKRAIVGGNGMGDEYMDAIMNSLTWKLAVWAINLKFPFKDKLYKLWVERKSEK